ncbi:MAG: DUF61 family protein [Methanothrix sp.]|nr:DUF61 family protein [Methanothrix sp.]
MAFSSDRQPMNKNILIKTIQTMNQHLPSRRLDLMQLMAMDKPGVKGKDNSFFIMEKSELELLSQSIPRFLWSRLRLPLLIEMSPDFGNGAARVQGEVEVEAVAKILGKDRPRERQMIIYLPEVRELRRKLPTTSQYAFVTNLRERDVD